MTSAKLWRQGLARSELLFAFSVMLLVASLLFPVGLTWRDHRYTRKTYAEMRRLIMAAEFYRREYRVWPVPGGAAPHDLWVGGLPSSREVIALLGGGRQADEFPEEHRDGDDFLEMAFNSGASAPLRFNRAGEVMDPWGTPYQWVFDANYDNVVAPPGNIFNEVVGEGLLVWSCGPDRRSGTGDDLLSWFP